MFKIFITAVISLFLTACIGTVPVKPATYAGNLPIYPAVVKTFAKQQVKIERIDVFGEEFRSDYVYINDLLLNKRFKILVKNKGGVISTELVGMQLKDANYDIWTNNDVTIVFNKNNYSNTISNEIIRILNDSNEYESSKSEVLSDFAFNYLVLKDLTDVGRDRWIDKNMKGRIYPLHLGLDNFTKNSNKDIKKNYVAKFSYQTKGVYPEFFIDLYTNNDRYALMKKGALAETQGSLSSARSFFTIQNSFSVSLIEDAQANPKK